MKENLHTLFPLYEGEKEIKMKKILSFLIAVCLMITGIPVTTFAQSSSREQADLEISSAQELRDFAEQVNSGKTFKGKVIKLTQDIVFDGVSLNNFTTIGFGEAKEAISRFGVIGNLKGVWYRKYLGCITRFQGTFDGQYHTISGINQTNTFAGLFACIGSDGIVKNVMIKDSKFNNVRGSGIAIVNFGKIINCHTAGNMSLYSYYNKRNIPCSDGAGIVFINEGIVLNSSNKISTTCGRIQYYGGITGVNRGVIQNCYNEGILTSTGTVKYCGGIVGNNLHGTIQNCYNRGNIIGYSMENNGGIVGTSAGSLNSGIIQNCYNIGRFLNEKLVDASMWEDNDSIGNIVGYVEGGIVRNCFGDTSLSLIGRNENILDEGNASFTNSDLQEGYLFTMLNRNRGENQSWLPWILNGTSIYPTLRETHEIYFNKTANGYITSDYSQGYGEQTITLTSIPNSNCKLSSLTVMTSSGQKIDTKLVKGKYQFIMPYSEVIISANFELNYTISLKSSKNGKIKSNKKVAFAGDKVTLTSVPKKKYKLKAIAVKTITGKKVALKKVNGKYQFTMPKENVIVSAKFKKK